MSYRDETNVISYRCWCACGGAANPRLFSRTITNARGDIIGTKYYDMGHGPLVAWPTPNFKPQLEKTQ